MGNYFLIKYGARIDFELNKLSLENVQGRTSTYLRNTASEMFSVPSRSEYIAHIGINVQGDYVFFPNEIVKDVFVASTIVRPKNGTIPVRILNTREEVVQIKQFKPVMKPLSEFLLLQKTDFETNGREKLLQENIDLKHLKEAERSSIEQICRKFSDIFLLPRDKLTYENIFEQKIPLKPRTSPVYKKPYRIPHSQRTIVEEEVDKMLKHDIVEEASSPWSALVL